MIEKTKLKGKSVAFIGRKGKKEGKFRTATVLQISGNTLTVGIKTTIDGKRKILNKERIRPDENKIFGVYYRNKLVEINWKRGT